MPFSKSSYVKVVDTRGNYRYGFILESRDRGYTLIIDLNEEGLSKINYDEEYNLICGDHYVKDFNSLLTGTEKKLIPLLAKEMTTRQIAEHQEVSPITIRCQLNNLKGKLQLQDREQLCAYAQGLCAKLDLK